MNATLIESEMNTTISKMTTEQIFDAIRMIGGGYGLGQDVNFVRAVLFSNYEDREGELALDSLMTSMGM